MPLYYRPIDRQKSEIRLFHLLPPSYPHKESQGIPRGRIYHADLGHPPSYVALSYVWGPPSKKFKILVDDKEVRVTQNLYNAVMALQPPKEPISIWIDALCINQADDKEKSWQVGLMKNIYEQATKTFAFLGPAEHDSDAVIDYLNSLGEKVKALEFAQQEELIAKWKTLIPGGTDAHATPQGWLREAGTAILSRIGLFNRPKIEDYDNIFRSMSGWYKQSNLMPIDGIKHFFQRAWWSRIWVLQEIAVPANAVFICGSREINRQRLSVAYRACFCLWRVLQYVAATGSLRDNVQLTTYQIKLGTWLFHPRAMTMLSMRSLYVHRAYPLVALLRLTCCGTLKSSTLSDGRLFQHLESTDPRDKVFALLNFASDREELREYGVFPDYSKTWLTVYKLTMAALLQQGYGYLFSLCQHSRMQKNLPSWVVDWSQPITSLIQEVETTM